MSSTIEEIHAGFTRLVNEVAGVPAELIEPDKHLVKELDIDSLSMVELMVAAEDEFGVKIPDAELDGLPTINDVVAYIHRGQA